MFGSRLRVFESAAPRIKVRLRAGIREAYSATG